MGSRRRRRRDLAHEGGAKGHGGDRGRLRQWYMRGPCGGAGVTWRGREVQRGVEATEDAVNGGVGGVQARSRQRCRRDLAWEGGAKRRGGDRGRQQWRYERGAGEVPTEVQAGS